MTRYLVPLVLIVLLFSAPVAAVEHPEWYRQITLSIPDHNIEATCHVYDSFQRFEDAKPNLVEREGLAWIVGFVSVERYGYILLISPDGREVVAMQEIDYELDGISDWYIVKDGYTVYADKLSAVMYISYLQQKWHDEYKTN